MLIFFSTRVYVSVGYLFIYFFFQSRRNRAYIVCFLRGTGVSVVYREKMCIPADTRTCISPRKLYYIAGVYYDNNNNRHGPNGLRSRVQTIYNIVKYEIHDIPNVKILYLIYGVHVDFRFGTVWFTTTTPRVGQSRVTKASGAAALHVQIRLFTF